jgi:hypothetical protein
MEILEVQPSVFENGRADFIGMVYTRHVVDSKVTRTGAHPFRRSCHESRMQEGSANETAGTSEKGLSGSTPEGAAAAEREIADLPN